MQKALLYSLLVLVSWTSFAQSTVKTEAQIDKVTVFLSQAQIANTARTAVPTGTTKVSIENVAQTADPNSFQVSGKGNFTILGVKFKQSFLGNEQKKPLEDSLEIAQYTLDIYNVNLDVINQEYNLILANQNIKSEKDGVVPEDLKDMGDFFKSKLTELGLLKIETNKEIKNISKKIDALKKEINQLNGQQSVAKGVLEVTIQSKSQQNIELNFEYLCFGVGWSPLYDLRVAKDKVNLISKANIWQNTGIDWKNVYMTLSTNNPSTGGQVSDLGPQFLSIYEPRPMPMMSKSRKSESLNEVMTMQADADAPPAGALMAAASMDSEVRTVETTLAVNYELKIPYTIAKGGNPETVDIQSINTSALIQHTAVPKAEEAAFLTAHLTDWQKLNLLPGTANVYLDGAFVGETFVGKNELSDTLTVSLGKDKKIIVKRESQAELKTRKTLKSSIEESFAYKISLRNTKTEAATVNIQDQIPVSQDSRISVEADELSGGVLDPVTGKIVWKTTLPPNETKNFLLKYTVKYPKGKTVNNL